MAPEPTDSRPGIGGSNREPPDRFLKIAEVCQRAGLGRTMIYGLIKTYRFPAPYKIGPKIARWSEKELLAWITDVKDGKLAAQEGAFE